MLTQISEWAELDQNTILLDLCCGTGVIGIALSPYVKKVIGIEMIESAVEDCIQNCELNELSHSSPEAKCEFFAGKCEDLLPDIVSKIENSKIVAIVDPPRSGLHSTVLKSMRTCKGLEKIVYVSCNATSQAENLHQLCMPVSKKRKAPGFQILKYCGADLFPHSEHVECIALLERYYG